jgi:biotin carboxyl carrier protein
LTYEITLHGTTRVVTVERRKDGRYSVTFDGVTRVVDLLKPTPEAFQMLIDGEGWEAGCVATADGFLVDIMGASTDVQVVDPRRKALKVGAGAATGTIVTQMPGRVVRLLVAAGTPVTKGQALLVVEAMKMENEMKSPVDGVLAEYFVAEGQSVEAGTKLARVDA